MPDTTTGPHTPDPAAQVADEIAWSMALEGRPLTPQARQRLHEHLRAQDRRATPPAHPHG